MITLPFAEVDVRFSDLVDQVAAQHERVLITRDGRGDVAIVAADDLESLEATVELLRDSATQDRVRDAERDVERGDVVDEATVRARVRKASADRARHPHRCPPAR